MGWMREPRVWQLPNSAVTHGAIRQLTQDQHTHGQRTFGVSWGSKCDASVSFGTLLSEFLEVVRDIGIAQGDKRIEERERERERCTGVTAPGYLFRVVRLGGPSLPTARKRSRSRWRTHDVATRPEQIPTACFAGICRTLPHVTRPSMGHTEPC